MKKIDFKVLNNRKQFNKNRRLNDNCISYNMYIILKSNQLHEGIIRYLNREYVRLYIIFNVNNFCDINTFQYVLKF